MESFVYGFGALIAAALLVFIAEPLRFMPQYNQKKKNVGSTYWGFYEGAEADNPEELRTIELSEVARKTQYVAGSSTYAMGKGVNMSGRK